MWWIWIIAVVVIAAGILVATLAIKGRKKGDDPDGAPRGWERYKKQVDKRDAALDGTIDESTRKIERLNGEAEKIAADAEGDHAKISAAGDWDDLDAVARDIDRRR